MSLSFRLLKNGVRHRKCPPNPAWSETLACADALFVRESGDLGFGQWRNTVGPHREDEESKPMMHEPEKSDSAVVATKPANKAGQPVAELVERRAGTGRNANQQSTCRAQNRESVSQALGRVRQAATICCLSPNTPGRSRMP